MDDLHQGFLIEIERLKAIVKKNAESLAQLPSLSGWHPDDAADCPGLDVLATDDRLVLSTHNSGRYRAPHLPSDPLPVGSVVRFRCVPAGSHKLNGAAEIRCLGAKRWSSKPPRCQPLLTLDQIMDHFSLPEGACLRPVVPEELSVSPDKDWYETGTRISYSCQGGKILVGMPNSTCHEGQWMGRSRSCR
ncbi:hypothetical protein MTO96_023885 [Rhipicephalus appendiculatus]